MTLLLLASLALFVLQSLIANAVTYLGDRAALTRNLKIAAGNRDTPPPMPLVAQRANRAFNNLREAMPVFLTLALLTMQQGKDEGSAQTGALVFLACRTLYVPAYMAGPPGGRSLCWVGSWVGLGMMIAALLG